MIPAIGKTINKWHLWVARCARLYFRNAASSGDEPDAVG